MGTADRFIFPQIGWESMLKSYALAERMRRESIKRIVLTLLVLAAMLVVFLVIPMFVIKR